MSKVEMIWSCGERRSGWGGGRVEKSGGVEGAGGSASRSSCEGSEGAWLMLGWMQGRFAEMDVKDCEKENT